jgi:chromosome segregation ATPase
MADGDKTFTEQEHIAILADRVATETAAITAERDQLKAEKSDLQSQLDVAESAKVAAEQAKEKAEQELADFKTGLDELAQAEARKGERLTKVKEVAAHLGDEFLSEENEAGKDRVARIVAMDESAFDGYVADLKATAPATTSTGAPAPRETAMAGAASTAAVPGGAPSQSAARGFLLARYTKES